jgi:hypothetical protein
MGSRARRCCADRAPLALPLIFGGIKTSTVNVIATATIAPLASVTHSATRSSPSPSTGARSDRRVDHRRRTGDRRRDRPVGGAAPVTPTGIKPTGVGEAPAPWSNQEEIKTAP